MTGDEQARIDWPEGLVQSAALAAMTWGGPPPAASDAVSEMTMPSGGVAQDWQDALELGGRTLTPKLTFVDGRLVRIEVADLRPSELSTLALGADRRFGLVSGSAGVTGWVVDFIDNSLSLEPDPELTDAGMI